MYEIRVVGSNLVETPAVLLRERKRAVSSPLVGQKKKDGFDRRFITEQDRRRRRRGVSDSMPGPSCDPGDSTQADRATGWRAVVYGVAVPRAGFPVFQVRAREQQQLRDIRNRHQSPSLGVARGKYVGAG